VEQPRIARPIGVFIMNYCAPHFRDIARELVDAPDPCEYRIICLELTAMFATIVPWPLIFITTLVVYALVRKMILERRLAALIRRQAHWCKQEED
jgi:hypothetical protein